jgi:hypothetical protein
MTFQEWWYDRRLYTVPFEGTAYLFGKSAWDAALKQSEHELNKLKSELKHFYKLTRKLVRQKLDLQAEIGRLQTLNTPHPCQDCDCLVGLNNCVNNQSAVSQVTHPTKLWLCGHFQQKKATK